MSSDLKPAPPAPPRERVIRDRVVRLAGDRVSLRIHARSLSVGIVLVLVLLGLSAVTLTTGDYEISLPDVIRTLFGSGTDQTDFIVNELRLPRLLTAIAVGAAFGVSGAILQSLTRNPLGSPDVVGFTSGASTGALVVILLMDGTSSQVSVGAVAGGLITSVVVYVLAYRGGVAGFRLILVGIGIAFMLDAFNSYLLTRARLQDAVAAQVWLIGSLNGRGWDQLGPVVVALCVFVPIALYLGRRLSTMELGDETAQALGVPVQRTRLVLLLVAVALAATATSAGGPIDFVALAAPQVAKRLTGGSGPGLIPAALVGAVLLVGSDLAAQRVFAPTQLPVGIATSAVGGIYLAWLLAHEWRKARV